MLSSRLKAFVIPTSQKSAIATPRTSFVTSSTRRPAAIAIPAAANWRRASQRAQVADVVDEPGDEEDPAPARIPASSQDGSTAPTATASADAGGEPGRDADAAERRRRAVVPALAGRGRRGAPIGERSRAQRTRDATGSAAIVTAALTAGKGSPRHRRRGSPPAAQARAARRGHVLVPRCRGTSTAVLQSPRCTSTAISSATASSSAASSAATSARSTRAPSSGSRGRSRCRWR